jgi:histidyl-tRNA synthetase
MFELKIKSENELVLRPEGTAGVMRMVLENSK